MNLLGWSLSCTSSIINLHHVCLCTVLHLLRLCCLRVRAYEAAPTKKMIIGGIAIAM